MSNNKKVTTDKSFEEKVAIAERRQKTITRIVCFALAALMVLGGATGIIVALFTL